MSKPKPFLHVFTERGPLIVLAVVIAVLVGIIAPASAQFFNFGGPPPRPPQQRQQPAALAAAVDGSAATCSRRSSSRRPSRFENFSKAPPPEKRETVPERNVLVLGDGMSDWLAYGLEDAYAEQPDMGVIRKAKTTSGLIKYQPKGDPADWAAAAKGILATEKPDAIVVMLGLNDRVPMREPAAEKSDAKSADKKDDKDKKDARAKPRTPSLRMRSPMTPPPSPTTSRSIPNCRRTMPPTMPTRRRHRAGKEHAFAERHLSSFARNAGSNSTARKSKR